ncbi:hypothetical protein ACQPZF_17080 [Actinosynnema sp. CS-041913]|uniref:hypothetical protein n=1 Tax=Actinosynnema sp. CS-041913 TaxID=3239917 RepID=UPI003D8B8849
MKRLVIGAVLVTAFSAAGVALTAPAWGAPDLQACGLGADSPYWISDGTIRGVGSRTDCGGTVTLTVRIAKDRPFQPDTIHGTETRTEFGNGNVSVDGACAGYDDYYTWTTSSSGNELESGRTKTC